MEKIRHISKAEEFPLNTLGNVEYRKIFSKRKVCPFGFCYKKNLRGQDQTEKPHWHLDMNHYATKKSTAQSMLDIALLMANSSQLKTALQEGPEYRYHLIALIILSITLQVIVGLLLIIIVKHNLNDERKQPKLNTLNNVATVFIFIILIVNILITALGSDSARGYLMMDAASPQMDCPGDY